MQEKRAEHLPLISKRQNVDINFDNHFRKRQMSVVDQVKRNIEMEMQKHQSGSNMLTKKSR